MIVLVAFAVGIVTWFVVGSIPNMLGNFHGWAALFVLFIGPTAGWMVGRGLIAHFDGLERAKRDAEAALQRRKAHQQECRQAMVLLCDDSIGVFEMIPVHLRTAAQHLDQAEVDFAEGAFAPFWDSIEKAVKTLGGFDQNVQQINDNSKKYKKLIKEYEASPPEFPLSSDSVAKLAAGTAIDNRLKAIVRRAQRNFQFATIYEQRKTNQILVAGFTNLAQALDQMTWRIQTSIGDLTSSIDAMGSTLNESLHTIHSQMSEGVKASAKRRDEEASGRAARENKVIEMLDNIQRGRRPSSWEV